VGAKQLNITELVVGRLNVSGFGPWFNKNGSDSHRRAFHLKNDSDSDKINSSHESGKNLITWAWPTSTTII
jgi:hypothetical protein